jgi:hypothetical protein
MAAEPIRGVTQRVRTCLRDGADERADGGGHGHGDRAPDDDPDRRTPARRSAQARAEVAEPRERDQRDDDDDGAADGCRRRGGGHQRQCRADRERHGRRPRGLQRPREPLLVEPELVAQVRRERAALRQRPGDFGGELVREPALLVDRGQLAQLASRVRRELVLFEADVGLLGIALGADRDVLAGGHREGSGDESGDAGGEDGGA